MASSTFYADPFDGDSETVTTAEVNREDQISTLKMDDSNEVSDLALIIHSADSN